MKEIIAAENAPATGYPNSPAVVMGDMVFVSGQIGIDPATGKLPEGVAEQIGQTLTNLDNVLKAGGASMQDVVKTTIFLVDLKDLALMNRAYGERFGSDFPAGSCVQVAALPLGAAIQIEAIAFKSADEAYSY